LKKKRRQQLVGTLVPKSAEAVAAMLSLETSSEQGKAHVTASQMVEGTAPVVSAIEVVRVQV